MDLLTILSIILASQIGATSLVTSRVISKKNRKIETYFNDLNFDIEAAPILKQIPNNQKIDSPEIMKFIDAMSECEHFNKNKLPYDLQQITINGINPILYRLKNFHLGGHFEPDKNHIEYANIPEIKELIINHELLHASTYFETENVKICGLQQIRGDKEIAESLDEAMDMYVLKKYFNQSCQNAYKTETILFDKITEIIPLDFLEKCYFGMDLLGLVKYLENYDDKTNIIRLIRSFDFVHEHGIYSAIFKDKQFNETIVFISKSLVKWYTNSNYQRALNTNTNEDEYLNQVAEYIDSIRFHYKFFWKDFEALNNEILNDSINESDIPLDIKMKVLNKTLKKPKSSEN